MIDSERQQFGKLLTATMGVYGREATRDVFDIWWATLRRFEYAEVRSAFSRHVQNVDVGQHPPKPADILRTIEGGGGEGRALGAWTKVISAIERVGSWQSVVFDDPLIHVAIGDMGGWLDLCMVTEDEVPFKAQEFQKRYRALMHNPPDAFPAKLTGQAEAENRKNDMHGSIAPPMLVGKPQDCQQILERGSNTPRLSIRSAGDVLNQMGAGAMLEHRAND